MCIVQHTYSTSMPCCCRNRSSHKGNKQILTRVQVQRLGSSSLKFARLLLFIEQDARSKNYEWNNNCNDFDIVLSRQKELICFYFSDLDHCYQWFQQSFQQTVSTHFCSWSTPLTHSNSLSFSSFRWIC